MGGTHCAYYIYLHITPIDYIFFILFLFFINAVAYIFEISTVYDVRPDHDEVRIFGDAAASTTVAAALLPTNYRKPGDNIIMTTGREKDHEIASGARPL